MMTVKEAKQLLNTRKKEKELELLHINRKLKQLKKDVELRLNDVISLECTKLSSSVSIYVDFIFAKILSEMTYNSLFEAGKILSKEIEKILNKNGYKVKNEYIDNRNITISWE
jgi:hypothetical protein